MRGCVEIKYSRRELRPPLGLVVAWNSVDFTFALIRLDNQKYHISQKYSFFPYSRECVRNEEKKFLSHDEIKPINIDGKRCRICKVVSQNDARHDFSFNRDHNSRQLRNNGRRTLTECAVRVVPFHR